MTVEAATTLAILIATLLVLASRRLRPDLTAVCVTLVLLLAKVLSPAEAFSAFGQPVIIIIPCVYILGAALYETGVATLIADRLARISRRGQGVLRLVVMLTAALLSAVLSSMLVIAILMPAVLRVARRARTAPAQLLLPLVSAATMGNLLTVIGTVSTLVVSDLLAADGHGSLGFFSLAPYGLVSLGLAILWYALAGRRLLRREPPAEPLQPSLDEVEHAYGLDRQLYRLRIRSISDLIGRPLDQSTLSAGFQLNVLAVQPDGRALQPARPDWVLECDDVLLVEGAKGDVLQAASMLLLEPMGAMSLEEFNRLEEENLRLAELMVPFRSRLVGRTLEDVRFRERYGLNILAAHRQGRAMREDLPSLTLEAGDSLLVQGPQARILKVGEDMNLVLVTQLGPQPGDLVTRKAKLTLLVLALMLISVVSGLLPLVTASLAAAVVLILTGCLRLDRAYRSIDGSVMVLIGGMLPLALALEKTGAAAWIAGRLNGLGVGMGSWVTLSLLYLFTLALTQVVSNSATAALVTPIALNLASSQGLDPHPFALAVALAVTTSYATPLVNADNLLVREAGRYSMRDYLVNGLPLVVLQSVVLIPMLLAL